MGKTGTAILVAIQQNLMKIYAHFYDPEDFYWAGTQQTCSQSPVYTRICSRMFTVEGGESEARQAYMSKSLYKLNMDCTYTKYIPIS